MPQQARTGSAIDQARQLIAERSSDENFTVQALARELGLSRSHFTRRFRQRYQRSPAEQYETRLGHASELLAMTDLPVAEVARRSGFSDPSWFGVVFRRAYDQSPSAWRVSRQQA